MQNASHIYQSARVRTAPAKRTVLALGAVLVFACGLLAPAVQAQEAQQPRVERQQPREAQRERHEAQRQEMMRQEMLRQELQRHEERAYEEQQRRLQAQQEPQQEGQRRNGRMTADERSELRRQINEANQEIYARPRGRR